MASTVTWVTLILTLLTQTFADGELKDYCENDIFQASCEEGEVIQIHYAQYGRMRSDGTCITPKYGSIGCKTDVLGYLDQKCSGRRSCDVTVSTLVPEEEQACPKDFRSYLQANYSCSKVTHGGKDLCQSSNHIRVTGSEGYLSSFITQESSLGALDCPWLVEVKPGQTMLMSMWDFSWKGVNRPEREESVCHVYAIIKETAASTSETICAGTERFKHIYTSQTNIVEVRLVVNRQDDLGHFLIKFEAQGCGDVEPPKNGWFERRSDTYAILGCNLSEDKWSLRCEDTKWKGHYGNCSAGDSTEGATVGFGGFGFSSGLSILVIILIAVAIGVVILLIGLLVLRRQLQRRPEPPRPEPEVYDAYTAQTHEGNLSTRLSKSAEILDPYQGENAYSRTWQMHRHNYPDGNYDTDIKAYNDNNRYVEHVYESPKFERKEYPHDTMQSSGPSVQYYELESDHLPPGGPVHAIDDQRLPPRNQMVSLPGYGINNNANIS